MKKIMIAAVAVMLGIAANAAAVGWTCAGAAGYSNYGVYIIGMNGVTSVDQIVGLAKTGSDLAAYQFGGGTVAANGSAIVLAANSGKTITYSGTGTDSYSAFIVVFDAEGANGSYTSVATISMDNDATNKAFAFGNQSTALTANKFTVTSAQPPTTDVPEPTSGLLLLVGAAGLALRRRRA